MMNLENILSVRDKKKLGLSFVLAVLFVIIKTVCQDLACSVEKNVITAVIVFFIVLASMKKQSKAVYIYLGIFSIIFSFFYSNNWSKSFISYITLFLFVTLITLGTANIVDKINLCTVSEKTTYKTWAAYFALIMAFWVVVFLATGPVKISEDSSTVISEALGHLPLSNGNPVLYTLLVALFLKPFSSMGMMMVGAYLLGLFQMCIIAAILSYSLYYLEKSGVYTFLVWVCGLYFVLTPVFAINAITVWKDIPYNAVLLLLMIKLYQAAKTRGRVFEDKKYMLSLAIICLLSCFLRGNGFFIVLLVAIALIAIFKDNRKSLCLLLIPLLLFVKVVDGPIYSILGIESLGAVEAQAMPLQMVARAVVDGAELTAEQEQAISSVMPIERIKEVYVSSSVDYIKFDEQFDAEYFASNKGQLFKVWVQLAPKNIKSYSAAWLGETMGYWKIGFRGQTVLTNERFDGHEGIFYKDIIQKLADTSGAQWFFARGEFLSLGFFAFLMLFSAFYFASRKRYIYILPLLPLLATWLGLMIGAPTYCDFRYMLVFPYALPFSLFLLFDKSK